MGTAKDAGQGHQDMIDSILEKKLAREKITSKDLNRIGADMFGHVNVPGLSNSKVKTIFKNQFSSTGVYKKHLKETVDKAIKEVEKTGGAHGQISIGEKSRIRDEIEKNWVYVQRQAAVKRADVLRERHLKIRQRENAEEALKSVKETMHDFGGQTKTIGNMSGSGVKKDPFKQNISGRQLSAGQAKSSGFLGSGGRRGGFSKTPSKPGFAGSPKISGTAGAPSTPPKTGGTKPMGL